MLCPCDIFSSTNVKSRTIFHFEALFSTQPINLAVEEISRNKSFVQTQITFFINQKQKHVSIRHNSILTLMKFAAPFFCIDVICMIYLYLKYFLVVCLSIHYEKLSVKTTLTAMGHFFAMKINFCPSDIIWNSIASKWQCLKHISRFLIHNFCKSSSLWQEISSSRLDLQN